MRSFILFIREPRVGVVYNVVVGDAQWLVAERLQWGECRIPEWDAARDDFFNSHIEITVFVRVEVVDVACDPAGMANER